MTPPTPIFFPGCHISIIIPCYNAEGLLSRCVASVVNQTFTNFEIILVDGGSTDGSRALMRALAAKHPNLRWISENDAGVYDAMNKGVQLARGSWLFFLGADDSLRDATVLERMAGQLDDAADFVYGDVVLEHDPWGRDGMVYGGEFSIRDMTRKNICHQAIFYSRRIFERFGGYDTEYRAFADWELNLRLFNKVKKKYVPVKIANFHGGGLSAGNQDRAFRLHFVEIITRELNLDSHSVLYREQARGLRHLWEHYGRRGKLILAFKYFRLWLRHENFRRLFFSRAPAKSPTAREAKVTPWTSLQS